MRHIYMINRFHLLDKTDEISNRIRKACEDTGQEYVIEINKTPEESTACVLRYKDSGSVLTCVGGDGTINHLVNDVAGSDTVISFIPFGTGNDFFHACSERLKDGISVSDTVRINDRFFINAACFGIDADIANDEAFIHNRLIPRSMRFNAAAVYHFLTWKKGRHLRLEFDSEIIEKDFITVVASNSRYYGGGYNIAPDSRNDDGVMTVCIADHLKKLNMARTILSMKHAGHLNNPAVRIVRIKNLVISSDRPFAANIDGERLVSDRFELELLPKSCRIWFDRAFLQKCHVLA